ALAGVAHHQFDAVRRAVFIQPVVRGDGQAAAVGHRLDGVDDEVDQHLLELAAVDLDRLGRLQPDVDLDAAAFEVVGGKHEAVVHHRRDLDRLGVAGKVPRAGELQQFGDDQTDALDLLADQPD